MKTKSFFLALALLLSTVASLSTLSAQEVTPELMQTAAPYFSPLLQLEATPPAGSQTLEEYNQTYDDSKSIAFPVTAGLMTAMLNFLAADQDYFNLYTPTVAALIDRNALTPSNSASGAKASYHFTCHSGQRDTILGYLSCFDIQAADALADSVSNPNSSYEIYNNVGIYGKGWSSPSKITHHKILSLNLGYDYLSPNIIAALYGTHADPNNSNNSMTIGYNGDAHSLNKDGTPKTKGLPLNAYYFNITLAFKDSTTSDVSGANYGDVYDQHDPDQNYTNNK